MRFNWLSWRDKESITVEEARTMTQLQRSRLRKRGVFVPALPIGVAKGYKQTREHAEGHLLGSGPNHPNWIGERASDKTGRGRAERLYPKVIPCESCGESKKRIDRHHKDGNTKNNISSNVKFLCRICHMKEDGRWEGFIEMAKRSKGVEHYQSV